MLLLTCVYRKYIIIWLYYETLFLSYRFVFIIFEFNVFFKFHRCLKACTFSCFLYYTLFIYYQVILIRWSKIMCLQGWKSYLIFNFLIVCFKNLFTCHFDFYLFKKIAWLMKIVLIFELVVLTLISRRSENCLIYHLRFVKFCLRLYRL